VPKVIACGLTNGALTSGSAAKPEPMLARWTDFVLRCGTAALLPSSRCCHSALAVETRAPD